MLAKEPEPAADDSLGNALGRASEMADSESPFGGGLGGREPKELEDGLAFDKSNSMEKRPEAESRAEKTEVVVGESCVRLDRLIFVQIPADRPVDEYIASVFRDADVQMQAGEQPESFGELAQQRSDLRKRRGDDALHEAGAAADDVRQSQEAQIAGQAGQPALSPAPEYLRPDTSTTAYWVDAEVRQIRRIMDRLGGAVIVGFPDPGRSGLQVDQTERANFFPANPALARRLGHPQILGAPDDESKDESIDRSQRQDQSSDSERAITLLGLDGTAPTARYRILFVFHAVGETQNSSPAAPANPVPSIK
jgi:hypothetical protein